MIKEHSIPLPLSVKALQMHCHSLLANSQSDMMFYSECSASSIISSGLSLISSTANTTEEMNAAAKTIYKRGTFLK